VKERTGVGEAKGGRCCREARRRESSCAQWKTRPSSRKAKSIEKNLSKKSIAKQNLCAGTRGVRAHRARTHTNLLLELLVAFDLLFEQVVVGFFLKRFCFEVGHPESGGSGCVIKSRGVIAMYPASLVAGQGTGNHILTRHTTMFSPCNERPELAKDDECKHAAGRDVNVALRPIQNEYRYDEHQRVCTKKRRATRLWFRPLCASRARQKLGFGYSNVSNAPLHGAFCSCGPACPADHRNQ